jgi:hypothetical protein
MNIHIRRRGLLIHELVRLSLHSPSPWDDSQESVCCLPTFHGKKVPSTLVSQLDKGLYKQPPLHTSYKFNYICRCLCQEYIERTALQETVLVSWRHLQDLSIAKVRFRSEFFSRTSLDPFAPADWQCGVSGQGLHQFQGWSLTKVFVCTSLSDRLKFRAANITARPVLLIEMRKGTLLALNWMDLSKMRARMTASTAYIAAATNRFNQAADISPSSNLIAFASSRLLALWNLNVTCISFPESTILTNYRRQTMKEYFVHSQATRP